MARARLLYYFGVLVAKENFKRHFIIYNFTDMLLQIIVCKRQAVKLYYANQPT
jgi:hypothetical protein